eukprot:gene14501-4277_t
MSAEEQYPEGMTAETLAEGPGQEAIANKPSNFLKSLRSGYFPVRWYIKTKTEKYNTGKNGIT